VEDPDGVQAVELCYAFFKEQEGYLSSPVQLLGADR